MRKQRVAKQIQDADQEPRQPTSKALPPRNGAHSLMKLPAIGNQAFGQLLRAKLNSSQPGDRHEEEADRVADRVMRMPDSMIARQPAPGGAPAPTPAPTSQPTSTPKPESPSPTATAATPASRSATEPIPSTKAPLFWRVVTLDTYPLLAEILGDLFWDRPTGEEREPLKIKGYESAGLFTLGTAGLLQSGGFGGGKYDPAAGLSKNYKVWKSYVDAIEPLTPSTGSIIDGLSTMMRLRLDDYLASDRFTLRLKQHPVAVAALLLAAEGTYYAATSTEGAPGELSNTPKWSGLTGLPVLLLGAVFKEQLKAPDFFNLAPLIMKSHPAYKTTPFAGEAPPADLTLEGSEGAGPNEGGKAYKFATTLNIAKLTAPKDLKPKDLDDLRKYRGPQGSIWFSWDSFDPAATMAAAGRLAESKLKSGFLLGSGGFLATLETGATFDGPNAAGLTSWFLKGGFGYSGPKQSVLNKIGFTATFLDFKPRYNLAPLDPAGASVGGTAARFTPFLGLDFGSSKSKLSFATAISLVTGSTESFGVSDIRGDISYTYMGERSEEKLPVFKATVSGSASRFDWWNKDSPWMYGVKSTLQAGPLYGGAQVMTGAGNIPDQRAALIDKPENVKKNFSFLVTAGWLF